MIERGKQKKNVDRWIERKKDKLMGGQREAEKLKL